MGTQVSLPCDEVHYVRACIRQPILCRYAGSVAIAMLSK